MNCYRVRIDIEKKFSSWCVICSNVIVFLPKQRGQRGGPDGPHPLNQAETLLPAEEPTLPQCLPVSQCYTRESVCYTWES